MTVESDPLAGLGASAGYALSDGAPRRPGPAVRSGPDYLDQLSPGTDA
jgi:hypothetical protein